MENNQEKPKTYRSRTGSIERKKASQAASYSAEERPASGGDDEPKPRDRKSAAEQPADRPSARQSFFKNRTPQSKSYDESERDTERESGRDAAPRRTPRTSRAPRKDDDTKPRRKPSGRDAGDRPQKSSGFDRFRKEKPRSERRAYDGQRPDEGRPYARKSYKDEEPRGYRRPSRAYGEKEETYRSGKPFGDRSRAKPQDEKPYARKPYGAKDERPYARKPYGAKDEKPYARKPYGAKDEKPYARKPYGAKEDYVPRSDRPRAAKKPFREIQVKEPNMPVRLNKFIANSGVCSRREADEYIQNGEITVNGEVVTALGTKVLPTDEIRWNGDKLSGEKKVYIVLNKPKGYVTTVEDPHADKTVMDLIAGACSERVYPVGRLDKNTTGVLLFTNDGELTKTLTHPSYSKRKVYQVTLDKTLKKPDMEQLVEGGVELEDGVALADEVGYTNMEDKTEVGLEIHSGRNRVVRRMFEALGYEVKKLDRVYFAGLTKKSLERGKWRLLSTKEVSMLKMGAYE